MKEHKNTRFSLMFEWIQVLNFGFCDAGILRGTIMTRFFIMFTATWFKKQGSIMGYILTLCPEIVTNES
jgi:hypothetical protein